MLRKFAIALSAALLAISGWATPAGSAVAQTCPCPGYGYLRAVVISDLHINSGNPERLERLRHIVDGVNANRYGVVDFVVVTGDVVSRINSDSGAPDYLLAAVTELRRLQVPYHIALGNHDYRWDGEDDSDIRHPWPWLRARERIWMNMAAVPPYHAFDHNGWRLIMLNSYRGNYLGADRRFDPGQINWLKFQLTQAVRRGYRVALFTHYPPSTDHYGYLLRDYTITPAADPDFYALLDRYRNAIRHIFAGHVHYFLQDALYGQIQAWVTAALGEARPYCPYPKYVVTVDHAASSVAQDCN